MASLYMRLEDLVMKAYLIQIAAAVGFGTAAHAAGLEPYPYFALIGAYLAFTLLNWRRKRLARGLIQGRSQHRIS
jgi:putative effector of murein hydrolase